MFLFGSPVSGVVIGRVPEFFAALAQGTAAFFKFRDVMLKLHDVCFGLFRSFASACSAFAPVAFYIVGISAVSEYISGRKSDDRSK